jgi:hypothetical protein
MLNQRGTRDTRSLGRLGVIEACASELPVSIDGGVTEAVSPLCLSAGTQVPGG